MLSYSCEILGIECGSHGHVVQFGYNIVRRPATPKVPVSAQIAIDLALRLVAAPSELLLVAVTSELELVAVTFELELVAAPSVMELVAVPFELELVAVPSAPQLGDGLFVFSAPPVIATSNL